MKKLSPILLITLLLACNSSKEEVHYDLIITNVSLIDGTGSPMQSNVNVYIRDNRIAKIDSEGINQEENVIDGADKYLIPGLFDCHVHTTYFEQDFPKLMHYGITGVFIPGGSTCTNEYYAQMRSRGNQDSIPAPRVFHTSQHFTMKSRHPVKTYASSNWREGETVFFLRDTVQIAGLVQKVTQHPIRGIKLTIEDGPAPPFVERMPQMFINKVVSEASKYDMPVFAHVSDNEELRMAIEGGVQHLLHYTGINVDFNDSSHLNLLYKLLDRDASWVTTLMIDKSFLYPIHKEWFDEKTLLPEYVAMKDSLTEGLIERARIYVNILKEEYGVEESSIEAFIVPQAEDIAQLLKIGFNMVLGSDTGNDFNFPGYSLHEEMQLMQMGGIDALDILKMGTYNAAKMIQADDSLGTIEPGKLADMILLNKNPLEDISNTLAIETVIKNGAIQKRIIN